MPREPIPEDWIDHPHIKRGPSDELAGTRRWKTDLDAQLAVEGTCSFFEARSDLADIIRTCGLPDIKGE